jgi:ABC-type branched-subunit amino acid transport system substrate-binding protein
MYAPYRLEGLTFARFLLADKPDAKLALLSQNDDVGRDYVGGLKEGLGDRAAKMIVKEVTFDTSSPTLDSQVVSLKAADADAVFLVATPKFGAQAIRKIAELNWKPLTYVSATATSVETVLKPAGLDNSKGLISAFVFKQPDDPRWNDDADVSELRAFLQKWLPRVNVGDSGVSTGYITAFLATKILEACGDDLSRENIIKQATNLSDVKAPLLLPGITFTTTPESYRPIRKMQMGRFDGATWVLEGPLISLEEPKR